MDKITEQYGSESLNLLRNKINEIIDFLSPKETPVEVPTARVDEPAVDESVETPV